MIFLFLYLLLFYFVGYALDNLSTLCVVVCNRIIPTLCFFFCILMFGTSFNLKIRLLVNLVWFLFWYILWLKKGSKSKRRICKYGSCVPEYDTSFVPEYV